VAADREGSRGRHFVWFKGKKGRKKGKSETVLKREGRRDPTWNVHATRSGFLSLKRVKPWSETELTRFTAGSDATAKRDI